MMTDFNSVAYVWHRWQEDEDPQRFRDQYEQVALAGFVSAVHVELEFVEGPSANPEAKPVRRAVNRALERSRRA